jgi:dihydroflavonol-4-reductase
MKVAVTGASGRIGNVVVRKLIESGHEVRVLVRRDDDRALAGLAPDRVRGDVFDEDALRALARGCEVLYHLAAVVSIHGDSDGRVRRTNVDGTRKVLEISRECSIRRVVYFSTFHVFSEFPQDEPLDETRPLAFRSNMAYTRTKAESLQWALDFSRQTGIEVVALCPTGVLGPFDFAPSPAGQMLLDFYRGKIPLLPPGGVDWVDVRDVADAAVAALNKGRGGEAYILSGQYARVSDLARCIGAVTQRPVPGHVAPDWLLRAALPFVAFYARISGKQPLFTTESLDTLRDGARVVSSEKARRELGYAARPIEDSIRDAYNWFKTNGYL